MASLGDRPDYTEAAAEEDEANAIDAFQATGPKKRLEGLCNLDKNALHIADVPHAPHEVRKEGQQSP